MKDNLIQDKSFYFALKIIELFKVLQTKQEYIISKQLLRSGTSIGANVEEAIASQSKKDFISKLYIALKEARESKYWIRLLNESNITKLNYDSYLEEINSIINILTKIIKTTQEKYSKIKYEII